MAFIVQFFFQIIMRIDILKTKDALDSNPRTQLHYLRSWENKGGQKTVETDRRSHQVNKSISVKRTSWQLNKVTFFHIYCFNIEAIFGRNENIYSCI